MDIESLIKQTRGWADTARTCGNSLIGKAFDEAADGLARAASELDGYQKATELSGKVNSKLMQELLDGPVVAVPNDWREAVQEFVDRCKRGEINSRYTYGKFKALLESSPSHSQQSSECYDKKSLSDLRNRLVTAQISAFLAGEKMTKEQRINDCGFTRQAVMEAARFIDDIIDRCPSYESEQQNNNTEGK